VGSRYADHEPGKFATIGCCGVKKCAYCEHSDEDANIYCRECGAGFAQAPSVTMTRRPVLSWFPRSDAEWTRSLAYPLCGCCFSLLIFVMGEGFAGTVVWRYAGPSIAGALLPLTGTGLGLVSLGPGLSRGFRILALILAAASVLGGILLSSELAEWTLTQLTACPTSIPTPCRRKWWGQSRREFLYSKRRHRDLRPSPWRFRLLACSRC